jgi:hypothetical protein
MQYTVRNVPPPVDAAARRRARAERKPLNQVVVEALADGLGVTVEAPRRRSVRDILGVRRKDAALEAALADQRRVDDEMWR